jgi:5-methylcytosine-specific restriction endonuclease McrA
MNGKRCSKCDELNNSEFKTCDKCRQRSREYERNWRAVHPNYKVKWQRANLDKLKKASSKYRQTHPDYHLTYYAANSEKKIEYQRKWREANPSKFYEYVKKWQKSNPERYRNITRNCNARRRGSIGSFTEEEEMQLFTWQQGACHYCGNFLYSNMPYHIEHKIPITRGGTNYIENIAISCPDCNRHKHDKTEEEFNESKIR